MSGLGVLVAIAGLWLAIGIALSMVMGRRGHNSFGWLVLGTVLGPLALVLALDARRHDEQLAPEAVQTAAAAGRGPVDVLVGFDGSPESLAAADAVVALLGERLGRLTLATVVPYGDIRGDAQAAAEALRRVAARTPERACQLDVLHGHPAAALREYAAAGGYDLVALGTRGAALTKAILGSAATELARDSKLPVLLVGPDGTHLEKEDSNVS